MHWTFPGYLRLRPGAEFPMLCFYKWTSLPSNRLSQFSWLLVNAIELLGMSTQMSQRKQVRNLLLYYLLKSKFPSWSFGDTSNPSSVYFYLCISTLHIFTYLCICIYILHVIIYMYNHHELFPCLFISLHCFFILYIQPSFNTFLNNIPFP